MATSSKKIIETLEENFNTGTIDFPNFYFDDLDKMKIDKVVKFAFNIIGNSDLRNSSQAYKAEALERFKKIGLESDTYAWYFSEDEIDELKQTLKELSDYYKANLDVETIFKKAKQAWERITKSYLITVTAVFFPQLVKIEE